MRNRFFIVICILAVTALAGAQSSPEPAGATQSPAAAQDSQSQAQNSTQFPAGTIIPVELSKSVDAKKVKSGDKIEAKVPSDLLSHGKIVIPRNTKIIGHITDVKAHSKDSADSMVGIAFDRIEMKGGQEVPLQAIVQAVARPLQSAALAADGGMSTGGGNMPSTPSGPAGGSMGGARSAPGTSYPTGTGQDLSTDQGSSGNNPAPLGPTSQGVVGMKGLSLNVSGQASVIRSEKDNVRLDSGTQMMLRVL